MRSVSVVDLRGVRTLAAAVAASPGVLRRGRIWAVAIWIVLIGGTLLARPPMAIDELSVLAATWSMWLHGSLVPQLNGQPWADQPPLLFWLIEMGWRVFGVSEIWARLVAPLFGLGAVLLIGPVARLLWPGRKESPALASVILVGAGGFAAYAGLAMPDLLLLFFCVLGLYGVVLARQRRDVAGWTLFGIALGSAFLARGSMAVLCLLPVPLAAPLWAGRLPVSAWMRWYGGLLVALVLGLFIGLTWLWPAVASGGPDLVRKIAFGSSDLGETMLSSTWFAPILPFFLYPWIWWRTLWRALSRQRRRFRETGLRFCLATAAAALAAAILLGDGQPQALLPLLPGFSLVAGRLIAAHGSKARDFHAVVPALLVLLVGVVFFLLNIVPVAHLDAIWRQFLSETSLPIWFGGSSLYSGLILLGGSFLLAQMSPRQLLSRTVQLALLPALLATALSLEFRIALRYYFDLTPIAQEIHDLQESDLPVGMLGDYRGEFDFSGRLEKPLVVLADAAAASRWAADNPSGVVVAYFEGSLLRLPARPLYLGPAGDRWAALWPAQAIETTAGAVLQPRF